MSKKSLIGSIFLFLLLLLAGNASSETEPVYAGWTVGGSSKDGYSMSMILRSTDSGETWTRQGAGQIANVEMVGVFAVDPYTAWVVGDPDSDYATIYHTTDGGSTWERKGSSNPAAADYVSGAGLKKVHVSGDHVWAVGEGTILHTSDGGETWTNHIPTGYENTNLQGVYVVDSNTVWVTGGPFDNNDDNHYVILKTTDAGLHWTRQDYIFDEHYPHAFLGISATDADTAWAVGANYTLLRTIDGGATWTKEPYPPFGGIYDLNEVYAVNNSTLWVAGDNGIYWTTDGGLTWDVHTAGPYVMGVSAVSSQEAWASGINKDRSIYHTTDGGTTWTKIEQLNGENLPDMNNISFATQPINPDYLIISLIKDVELFVDDDFLYKGQGNALIVKLEKALDRLVDDRLKAAVNALDAFSNQVDAFVRGGVLSPEDGKNLSDQVNEIIEQL